MTSAQKAAMVTARIRDDPESLAGERRKRCRVTGRSAVHTALRWAPPVCLCLGRATPARSVQEAGIEGPAGYRTAFSTSRSSAVVQARNQASKPTRTACPAPNGWSITAGRPDSVALALTT
jgi:hypothetical protein